MVSTVLAASAVVGAVSTVVRSCVVYNSFCISLVLLFLLSFLLSLFCLSKLSLSQLSRDRAGPATRQMMDALYYSLSPIPKPTGFTFFSQFSSLSYWGQGQMIKQPHGS